MQGTDHLRVAAVDDRQVLVRQRDRASVEELRAQAGELWVGDESSLVVEDLQAGGAVDDEEVDQFKDDLMEFVSKENWKR